VFIIGLLQTTYQKQVEEKRHRTMVIFTACAIKCNRTVEIYTGYLNMCLKKFPKLKLKY
jgi:hypothetical protein